jgi:hypothetical protein
MELFILSIILLAIVRICYLLDGIKNKLKDKY